MGNFDSHNRTGNSKVVIMETRTVHIGPVRRGAESEIIAIFDKQPNDQYPCGCKIDDADDEDIIVAAPRDVSWGKMDRKSWIDNPMTLKWHKSESCNKANHTSAAAKAHTKEDESLSMVLRAYNRKEHRNPSLDHQTGWKNPTGGRISTETEKRIAQLRNAGLMISSRPLSPSTLSSLEDTAISGVAAKIRDDPDLSYLPSRLHGSRMRIEDRPQSFKSNALQALLEKDSRHCRVIKEPSRPPMPFVQNTDPILRSKRSAAFEDSYPSSPRPQPADLKLDPIIAARPAYRGLRVSPADYPDPEAFGWIFVGSCEERRVEIFEKNFGSKGVVVLEFHYTTGTVQTTLEHPVWGKSLLIFARGGSRLSSGLSPKIYRKILIDPLGCNSEPGTNSTSDENGPSR